MGHPKNLGESEFKGWATRHVGVHIPLLRVDQLLLHDVGRVGRLESPKARPEVSSPEHVESGFGIPFFAGEFVAQTRMLNRAVVDHIRQCVVGLGETETGAA